MTIIAITLENFKGIGEPIRVELKPITLLFGPNSAGKSTIVQALHYAHEIFERQNINPDRTLLGGDSIDLGGFENLVYQHDLTLPMRIGFELDLSREDLPDYMAGLPDYAMQTLAEYDIFYQKAVANTVSAKVEAEIRWDEVREQPYMTQYRVWANGADLLKITGSADSLHIEITDLNPLNPVFFPPAYHPFNFSEDYATIDEDGKFYYSDSVSKDNLRKCFRPSAEEATETVRNIIARVRQGEAVDELIDEVISSRVGVGLLFPSLLHYFNETSQIPGITTPLKLRGQKLALPVWEQQLSIEGLYAEDYFEPGEIFNFVRMLSALTVGPGELVRNWLRNLCYIGPLRQVPTRNHKPATSPELSRWASGIAAYDILYEGSDAFNDKVNKWLAGDDRLASGYTVEVKKYRELDTDHPLMLAMLQRRIRDEDTDLRASLLSLPVKRRLLIRDEARDIELAPQDIGVGISQVLPLVVAALHQKTGLVAIEQPELHIHPAFQVALGDLFIEQVRDRSDLCFILETHSEHLMLRFLRRIRETSENEVQENRMLSPEELSIYFIERGETGISCYSIRVDEDGDFIDRWPRGFFNERAEELF
jgi:hypothetical protein